MVDNQACRERDKRRQRPPVVFQAFPKLIDQNAQAVQAAPDDEVPACAVPETAQQHRVHIVDVGGNLLSRSGKDDGYHRKNNCYSRQNVGQDETT